MRRFARVWVIVLLPLAVAMAVIPFAADDGAADARQERERLAADTLRSAQRLRLAEREAVLAESLHTAAMNERDAAPTPRPAVAVAPPTSEDPEVAALAAAIQEARRLRTVSAWLFVANQSPVSGGPRMRSLADSLRALERERDAIPPGPERDQLAAPLTRAMSRVGYTILAIAENRRSTLAEERGTATPRAAPPPVAEVATPVAARLDTLRSAERLRAARDTLLVAQRAHADAVGAAQRFQSPSAMTPEVSLAELTPAIALFALLVAGLLIRFALAMSRESGEPTLANAQEAERTIGTRVLATVRDAPIDGPARFRPSGVDPFRMLYLGLTATGTRARTMVVTGRDPEIVAAVGARLAISAAADHRTTLVVDLDPASIALSRTFRERAEPGLTDALAGAFKFREVARPVGSSDGLPITLMPAGTERDLPTGAEWEERKLELTKFRTSFEFTILVAPLPLLDLAVSLVETSPIVLSAVVGATTLTHYSADGATVRAGGRRLHGVVLWDAPSPSLPTRAELAAMISTRRGRTPGGSFAAVQKAISSIDASQK